LPYALPEVPPAKATVHIDQIHFDAASFLFDWLGKPIYNNRTLTFEQLHQAYGFVLYRTMLGAHAASILRIHGLRDFALVFVNGKRVGVLDRRLSQDSLSLAALGDSAHLDILVENLGRVNFGPNLLRNTKGITGDVELNGTPLRGWEMYWLLALRIARLFRTAGLFQIPRLFRVACPPLRRALPLLLRGYRF
jgi:beta-galactosidase